MPHVLGAFVELLLLSWTCDLRSCERRVCWRDAPNIARPLAYSAIYLYFEQTSHTQFAETDKQHIVSGEKDDVFFSPSLDTIHYFSANWLWEVCSRRLGTGWRVSPRDIVWFTQNSSLRVECSAEHGLLLSLRRLLQHSSLPIIQCILLRLVLFVLSLPSAWLVIAHQIAASSRLRGRAFLCNCGLVFDRKILYLRKFSIFISQYSEFLQGKNIVENWMNGQRLRIYLLLNSSKNLSAAFWSNGAVTPRNLPRHPSKMSSIFGNSAENQGFQSFREKN